MTGKNNIKFKPLTTNNERGKAQIVLKRSKKGELKFNKAELAGKAVNQFKRLITKIKDNYKDKEATKNMLMEKQ